MLNHTRTGHLSEGGSRFGIGRGGRWWRVLSRRSLESSGGFCLSGFWGQGTVKIGSTDQDYFKGRPGKNKVEMNNHSYIPLSGLARTYSRSPNLLTPPPQSWSKKISTSRIPNWRTYQHNKSPWNTRIDKLLRGRGDIRERKKVKETRWK